MNFDIKMMIVECDGLCAVPAVGLVRPSTILLSFSQHSTTFSDFNPDVATVKMDLSASSRIITSALTSLEIPPHEYEEDVEDEIHPDGAAKDDNESPADAGAPPLEDSLKDQQYQNNSFNGSNTSLIIPMPQLHFATSTPNHSVVNQCNGGVSCVSTLSNPPDSSMLSPSLPSETSMNLGDLVLAAISVMKGRKARPDTKRLCNWVHRKYGKSVQDVVDEIDNLCAGGVLEKVEYKGSISFRIVSDKKLHKRAGRRKSSNINQNDSEVSERPKPETAKRSVVVRKSPKKGVDKSPDTSQPLTVALLVTEQLNPGPEQVVSKSDIISAIETSSRPINKKNVFRDLDTILAQEIHLGYLRRINDEGFTLLKMENSKTYRGTIALKVSKRKPKPTQKLLEMEAAEHQSVKVKCEQMEEVLDPENSDNHETTAAHDRTEDQLKDDLIKEKLISNKLFKMKNKIRATKNKKMKLQNEMNPIKGVINELHEKQNNLQNSIKEVLESTEDSAKQNSGNEENKKQIKKKKESWQTTTEKKDLERKNMFVEKSDDMTKKKRKKKPVFSSEKRKLSNSKTKSASKAVNHDSLDEEDDRASPLQRSVSGRKKVGRLLLH